MTRYLREHFERAVDDDPGSPSGDVAHAAIVEGSRLRRRRNQLSAAGVAAGVVVVIGAVAAVNLTVGAPEPANPPVTVAAAMIPVAASSCTPHPVERDATDVVIFFVPEVTDQQRVALHAALRADPSVATLNYEGRQQAYEKFRIRWAKEPDLVAAVTADKFPDSFRLRLVAATQFEAVRSRYAEMDGVEQVVGRRCPTDAPVGGIQ